MNKLIVVIGFTFSFNCNCQNLVLNPSFEEYTDCFFGEAAFMYNKCNNWYNAFESPDYFNICSWDSGFIVPSNLWGYQIPKSGVAYAAFGTYGRYVVAYNLHEHLRGTLKNPLTIGTKYFVSFYVSATVNDFWLSCATNNIGAWFTTVPYIYVFPDSVNPSPVNNQAHINCTSIISDTLNWTQIFGSFIADSAYTYIILGNFFDDDITDTLMLDSSYSYCQAMYYLDDVCVSDDSLLALNYVYQKTESNSLLVYPNPANDILNIVGNTKGSTSLSIINTYGRKIKQFTLNETFNKVKISDLETGLYILIFDNGINKQIVKFLKL